MFLFKTVGRVIDRDIIFRDRIYLAIFVPWMRCEPGGGTPHMKGVEMLVGNFGLNP